MDSGFEYFGENSNFSVFQPILLPVRPAPRRQALHAQRLDLIRRHVETHLDDTALSAQSTAKALGMSVRSLHLALAGSSLTFGELVLTRRLELCRALLTQWEAVDSIADLAFACGFNSLSSFYRAFRRHFGTAPRALRAG